MSEEFGVKVEDESDVLSDITLSLNNDYVSLYNWQIKAISFVMQRKKAIIEAGTGVGKTWFAIECIKRILQLHPDENILIVVPKNVILETGWYSELFDAGIQLEKIGVFYGDIKEYTQITLTNMQNLDKVDINRFNVLIADECHWYATKRLLPFMQREYLYKIGLSATTERRDGKHYKLYRAFGDNIFKYSAKKALSDGILNPFNHNDIRIDVDHETYRIYKELSDQIKNIIAAHGSYNKIMTSSEPIKYTLLNFITKRKKLVNNYKRKVDVLAGIVEKHKGEKILVFAQFNEQTNKFYWDLIDKGVNCRVIHSGIAKEDRQKTLTDFKNDKFNVLLATKVLDEGYSLNNIDVGIITAGDSTARQTIQRLGRILRRSKNRSHLYQLYCSSTIEEEQADERSKVFKELAWEYNKFEYNLSDKEFTIR